MPLSISKEAIYTFSLLLLNMLGVGDGDDDDDDDSRHLTSAFVNIVLIIQQVIT